LLEADIQEENSVQLMRSW